MGLRAFILKRILYSFMLLLLVIGVNFTLFILMPGDPTVFLAPIDPAGGIQTPQERQEREQILREVWGYGEPYQTQLIKYFRNLLSFRFGKSFLYKTEVSEAMIWRIPYTVFLLGGGAIISMAIGITWGVMVIEKRGSIFDSASVLSALIMGALPTFWMGLVFMLVFYIHLGWFPNAGAFPREWAGGNAPVAFTMNNNLSPNMLNVVLSVNLEEALKLIGGYMHHAFLPMLTIVLFSFGGWLIFTRACMLETIAEDYIVTAKAKGLTDRAVMFRHALKNASLPIITSAALSFGFVLSGAMITEAVYTYPGLGRFIFDAIQFRDFSILMAVSYIISICVIVANIIADLMYGIIDPRIRYG